MGMKTALAGIVCVLAIGLGSLSACAPNDAARSQQNESMETAAAVENAAPGSVIAYHSSLNLNTDSMTEVSVETCASQAACHSGSWDSVIESTEDMWEGIGQISAANPHASHGTSGFTCESCHSLTGANVNQCNGCHAFETPEGWVDKDPATTAYGLTKDAPLY